MHVGHPGVTLTGEVNGDTITASKTAMPAKQDRDSFGPAASLGQTSTPGVVVIRSIGGAGQNQNNFTFYFGRLDATPIRDWCIQVS